MTELKPKQQTNAGMREKLTRTADKCWNVSQTVNIAELRYRQHMNVELSPLLINIVDLRPKAVYEYWNESDSANLAELRPEQYSNT